MAFKRNTIMNTGLGLNEKFLNDNFMELFRKVSGNINYSDMDSEVQRKILKAWLPFQAEGNLDANYPLYARFYIPPNVKEVASAKVSAITSKYRMDSGVASASSVNVTADVNLSMGGGGGGSFSGGGTTRPVERWGTTSDGGFPAPTSATLGSINYTGQFGDGGRLYYKGTNANSLVIPSDLTITDQNGDYVTIVDLHTLQHTHQIPPHSHSLIDHIHSGTTRMTIPAHDHPLSEGIKVSSVNPTNVNLYVNGTVIGTSMSGDGSVQNDIDFLSLCNIGAWNEIRISSGSVARITLYGVVEIIQEYTKE